VSDVSDPGDIEMFFDLHDTGDVSLEGGVLILRSLVQPRHEPFQGIALVGDDILREVEHCVNKFQVLDDRSEIHDTLEEANLNGSALAGVDHTTNTRHEGQRITTSGNLVGQGSLDVGHRAVVVERTTLRDVDHEALHSRRSEDPRKVTLVAIVVERFTGDVDMHPVVGVPGSVELLHVELLEPPGPQHLVSLERHRKSNHLIPVVLASSDAGVRLSAQPHAGNSVDQFPDTVVGGQFEFDTVDRHVSFLGRSNDTLSARRGEEVVAVSMQRIETCPRKPSVLDPNRAPRERTGHLDVVVSVLLEGIKKILQRNTRNRRAVRNLLDSEHIVPSDSDTILKSHVENTPLGDGAVGRRSQIRERDAGDRLGIRLLVEESQPALEAGQGFPITRVQAPGIRSDSLHEVKKNSLNPPRIGSDMARHVQTKNDGSRRVGAVGLERRQVIEKERNMVLFDLPKDTRHEEGGRRVTGELHIAFEILLPDDP